MKAFSSSSIDWSPFVICQDGEKAPALRSISTKEGLGDRLRFVAFAEKQAVMAFRLAAEIYTEVPDLFRDLWLSLAKEEEKHLNILLNRMKDTGVDPSERAQSLALWNSFDHCKTAGEFSRFMASAEDWGKSSGEKFHQTLLNIDPETAEIFRLIAEEEALHIELARKVLEQLN
jgi:rubrerythrin